MTDIVFHLIDDPAPDAFWFYAAELCAAAAEDGRVTYVVCANHDHVESFDEYLWQYKPDAFVPHTADPEDAPHAEVFIGADPHAGGFAHVINLSGRAISALADRERIDEVIDPTPENRAFARERWMQYRQEGGTPRHQPVNDVRSARD